MRAGELIKPELSTRDAEKLVKLIKEGSNYAGVLVMKSIANTLRYVQYSKSNYRWDLKNKKIKNLSK